MINQCVCVWLCVSLTQISPSSTHRMFGFAPGGRTFLTSSLPFLIKLVQTHLLSCLLDLTVRAILKLCANCRARLLQDKRNKKVKHKVVISEFIAKWMRYCISSAMVWLNALTVYIKCAVNHIGYKCCQINNSYSINNIIYTKRAYNSGFSRQIFGSNCIGVVWLLRVL